MRYYSEKKRIFISHTELVSIARRGIARALPHDSDEPSGKISDTVAALIAGRAEKLPLSLDFSAMGQEFTLTATVYNLNLDTTTRVAKIDVFGAVSASPEHPRREETERLRGEGFISAHALAVAEGLSSVTVRFHYVNPQSGEFSMREEILTDKKLLSFFGKCTAAVAAFAAPEVDRVTRRLPSMKNMRFPYPKIREGQEHFIRTAYRTLSRGGRLFAEAPTGTGKTVAALYPALRVLGDGRCEKVFYLTPKSTVAEAACDCVSLIASEGVELLAVVIPAKERACMHGNVCREDRLLCENSKNNRLAEATLALYKLRLPVARLSEIRAVAAEYKVCPYELSLSYAEICDVVICDENYLFDPRVYIRRFFDEGGRYAVLVDEAHNLADRAREMYSVTLTESELRAPAEWDTLGEHSRLSRVAAEAAQVFHDTLFPYVKEEIRDTGEGVRAGAAHSRELPTRLYTLTDELISLVEEELFAARGAVDDEARTRTSLIKDYYYRLKHFADILARFDSGYEMFVFFENNRLRVQLYCLDTGNVVRDRLSRVFGAVLFSATLSPLEYYKSTLGGERSDETLCTGSPFDPSQLSVSIVDSVSTRFSERDDTLTAITRVIAATVSAKRGNYIVFSPSFAYSEALARAFRAKYPKLRTLVQKKNMTVAEREKFLSDLNHPDGSYLIAFCVMGGIYAEGIDLAGESLIGAVVVGIGMPSLSYEREAIAAYYQDKYEMGKEYAYLYPGMNRVFQAAGRVIRREDDRGVIVLIDDRFRDPLYKKSLPDLWSGVRFIGNPKELKEELEAFWKAGEEE